MNANFLTSDPYVRRDSKNIKNTNTTTRTYTTLNELIYPQDFERLASDQQRDVCIQLKKIPVHLRQPVLDEWQAKCLTHSIKNPAGYLFGIIKKAREGEFRPSQSLKEGENE